MDRSVRSPIAETPSHGTALEETKLLKSLKSECGADNDLGLSPCWRGPQQERQYSEKPLWTFDEIGHEQEFTTPLKARASRDRNNCRYAIERFSRLPSGSHFFARPGVFMFLPRGFVIGRWTGLSRSNCTESFRLFFTANCKRNSPWSLLEVVATRRPRSNKTTGTPTGG